MRVAGERAARVLVVGVAPDLVDAPEDRRVEIRTRTGVPALVLVKVARAAGADLPVVGRRGGDFVARTLLGVRR